MVDPTTAGDYCRRFDEASTARLQTIFNTIRLTVWRQQPASFFKEAIIEALYDPANWASLSRAARQRAVSCYAWDHIAEQFIAQYRAALEARRGG